MNFQGRKVLVIGAAKSGLAAAEFLKGHGAFVYLNDLKRKEELPSEVLNRLENQGISLILGKHAQIDNLAVDLLIISPGVPLNIPTVIQAKEQNIPIWSELELASKFTKAPMIVVTGTNGKTTTTALLGQIFQDSGRKTFIGGNIGTPFISGAEQLKKDDCAVLEASSFQLETTVSFKPRVAVVLNLTPDHLDRHGSFQEYVEAKAKIFAQQTSDDFLILNYDDEPTKNLAQQASSQVIFFSRKHKLKEGFYLEDGYVTAHFGDKKTHILLDQEISIKGAHNLENALAALAAGWVMGVERESLAQSLRTFPGVAHRLEKVLIDDEITYINDSKGTNVDASIKALEAYDQPIILIAGGKSKGSDFLPLAEVIKEKVKDLVLVGQAAEEIEEAVKKVGYKNFHRVNSFAEAVKKARNLAQRGDIVLLSPACASFDMFRSYEHRGEVFKALVQELVSIS